jgi:general secretion pathway protein E
MNAPAPQKTVSDFVANLIETGALTEPAANRLLAAHKATGHAFDTVVVELGIMREEMLARALADYFETELAENFVQSIDHELNREIGLEYLSTRAVLPLKEGEDNALFLLVANPFDTDTQQMVGYLLGKQVVLKLATRSSITTAAAAVMAEVLEPIGSNDHSAENISDGDLDRLRDFAQQAPIVRLVTRITQTAADEQATDIHIEPLEHEVRIRIRVDGMLKVVDTVPVSFLAGISTRLKILANLDISERRLPQDGRIRVAIRGQEIDMRLSVIPSIQGETIVLRLLDRSSVALDLARLGFEEPARRQLEKIARQPNGIILVTGPTGSGKTTTLYALMSILNDPAIKIFTVEDPVEYQLSGITQLQTSNATGLTFARALRSVLRQDPDIILVGEIRDRETAEIAMQAALTGHLVLSTLHTNSAVGAITRLRDMGIEDYLVASTVKGIVSQRLVRKSCQCGAKKPAQVCEVCGGSGYSGRTVTHEIIEVTDALARMISSGAPEEKMFEHLCNGGLMTMETHARKLLRDKVTTLAEISRALRFSEVEAA